MFIFKKEKKRYTWPNFEKFGKKVTSTKEFDEFVQQYLKAEELSSESVAKWIKENISKDLQQTLEQKGLILPDDLVGMEEYELNELKESGFLLDEDVISTLKNSATETSWVALFQEHLDLFWKNKRIVWLIGKNSFSFFQQLKMKKVGTYFPQGQHLTGWAISGIYTNADIDTNVESANKKGIVEVYVINEPLDISSTLTPQSKTGHLSLLFNPLYIGTGLVRVIYTDESGTKWGKAMKIPYPQLHVQAKSLKHLKSLLNELLAEIEQENKKQ